MGDRVVGDDAGARLDGFLRPAVPAGRGRSRILSGHHFLSDTVVSGAGARTHDCGVHDRDAGGRHRRRTDLRRAALDERRGRSRRLAVAVPSRRPARRGAGRCGALLSDRSAGGRDVALQRGTARARGCARGGSTGAIGGNEQRRRRVPKRARVAAGRRVLHDSRRVVCHGFLAPANPERRHRTVRISKSDS